MAEGLEPVGAEIHRRLDQRAGGAAETRDGIVVDDDDAEGGVAEHDRPEARIGIPQAEGRAQRDAGDDAGQRDRQDDQQRDRLAAEEPGPRQRRRGKRAEDQRQRGRDRATLSDKRQRRPDVGPAPGDGEPLRGQPRRRPDVALLLGGEGIERRSAGSGRCRNSSPAAAAIFRPSGAADDRYQSASKAPMRLAHQR